VAAAGFGFGAPDFAGYLGSVGGYAWAGPAAATCVNASAAGGGGAGAGVRSAAELAEFSLARQKAAPVPATGHAAPLSLGSVFWSVPAAGAATGAAGAAAGGLAAAGNATAAAAAASAARGHKYTMRYNAAIPASAPMMLSQLHGAALNFRRGIVPPPQLGGGAAPPQPPPPPPPAGFAVFTAAFPQEAAGVSIGAIVYGLMLTVYYPSFLSTIGALAGTMVVKEAEQGVKRQQLVGGVRLAAYW
jgi:hypothetical protein